MSAEISSTVSNSLEDDVSRARKLADQLSIGPCADVEAGETRCLDRENNIARRKSEGFTSYRADRMCDPCSSFWHAEMAALTLGHALFLRRMAVADEQAIAG